jgi:hypothetical protein
MDADFLSHDIMEAGRNQLKAKVSTRQEWKNHVREKASCNRPGGRSKCAPSMGMPKVRYGRYQYCGKICAAGPRLLSESSTKRFD